MPKIAKIAVLGAMAIGIFGIGTTLEPSSAGAQSKQGMCRTYVNRRLIWRPCCYRCAAWSAGSPGTFVGRCIRWRRTLGSCAYDGRLN